MASKKGRHLVVGLVVTVAFAILFIGILTVGEEQSPFTPRDEYFVLVTNAEGLQRGSPVKLVGVQVGIVTEVELPEGPGEQQIRVTLSVSRAYSDRIRTDTEANLRLLSLLGREKFIELTLGSPGQAILPPGSEIAAPASDIDILRTQGTDIASDVAEITSALRIIFDRIQQQEGLLGQILMNPSYAQESMRQLNETVGSFREIAHQIETGQGLLGALINDPELRDRTKEDLGDLSRRVGDLAARLEDRDTPLGALLHGEGETAEILENVRQASRSLRNVAEQAERGDGLLVRLLSDGEYADRVMGDLESITRNMAAVMEKVNRGEGTLGGLVNDPGLYQGMRDVVTGLQESRLLRWMVNRYARKGERARRNGTGAAGE